MPLERSEKGMEFIMKYIKFQLTLLISCLLIFSYTFPCFAGSDSYIWSFGETTVETNSDTTDENETTTNNENFLSLESGSAILIEQKTGKILYSHNIHEQLRPASVTKVMSILLIMEALDSRKNIINRSSSL